MIPVAEAAELLLFVVAFGRCRSPEDNCGGSFDAQTRCTTCGPTSCPASKPSEAFSTISRKVWVSFKQWPA